MLQMMMSIPLIHALPTPTRDTHTQRTWVWPGHTPELLYTQLADPRPRTRGQHSQNKCYPILFHYIHYIYIYSASVCRFDLCTNVCICYICYIF